MDSPVHRRVRTPKTSHPLTTQPNRRDKKKQWNSTGSEAGHSTTPGARNSPPSTATPLTPAERWIEA